MRHNLGSGILSAIAGLVLGATPAGAGGETTFVEDFTTTAYRDSVHTTAWWDTTSGELKLFPFTPTRDGYYNTSGTAYGVFVSGDHAFVADGSSGLQVINIANPAAPTLAGSYNTPGTAYDVFVSGDHAFVADGSSGLQVINIANPAAPTLAGSYNTPGTASGVFVSGDHAFVADGSSGLQVINIANPAAPGFAGSYNTPGSAEDVFVAGDHAFVADWGSGLQVIDITSPFAPTLAGSYDTPDNASGVFVEGDRAFVGDGASGLQVIDITDPAAPALAGSCNTPGSAYGVFVSGDRAFVADAGSGLQVIEISDPAALTPVGSYDTPDNASGVFVEGDHAFVADWGSGLQVIDITNPAAPTLAGSCDTPGKAYDVFVSGDHAFVADGTSGLQVIDITNPAAPTLAGSYDMPGYANAVFVSGDHAFMVNRYSGLGVINIANPAAPTLAGFYDTPDLAAGVFVEGDYAFVADGTSGLQVIDIDNPAFPTLAGSYDTPGSAADVFVAGDRAFVADGGSGLRVIDITNPTAPTLAGSCDTPGSAADVFVAGDHAFMLGFGTRLLLVIQAFQAEVDTDHNAARSLTVDAGSDTIPRVRLTAAFTDSVAWEVSTDAGTSWQGIQSDGSGTAILSPGADLQWRSTLAWVAPGGPAVSQLRLDWLYHFALVESVEDIPDDQGGWARLHFLRSGHDFADDPDPAEDYIVWSRIDPPGAGLSPDASPAARAPRVELRPDLRRSLPLVEADGRLLYDRSASTADAASIDLPPGTWEILASFPAFEEEEYIVRVPTLGDSTSGGITYTVLAVSVHTQSAIYVSPPDSGYSVDNIAPGVPQNFAVACDPETGNQLTWDPAPEPDFQYFRVYRDTTSEFTPAPENLVHMTAFTEWLDPVAEGWRYYYQLTCLDHAGNESAPAAAGVPTSVLPGIIPAAYALHPNVPNPFNPKTSIFFDVPRTAHVRITLYVAAGRLVKTLLDAERAPGRHEVTWQGRDDAGRPVSSGIYFVTMDTGDFHQTRKITLSK